MTILFANEDGDYSYLSTKGKVYPKVMADLKIVLSMSCFL